jgi:hypothetical protein
MGWGGTVKKNCQQNVQRNHVGGTAKLRIMLQQGKDNER